MIQCEQCVSETGSSFWFDQITGTHLKSKHNTNSYEYRKRFPEALLIDEDIESLRIERIREEATGRLATVETREKMSISHREYWNSEEGLLTRDRMSSSSLEFWNSEEGSLAKQANSNRVVSEDTRKRMSASHITYYASENGKAEFTRRLQRRADSKPELAPYLSKGEKYVHSRLEEVFPGQYEYTGNGSFHIGTKNPDFKHISKMKIIEFFGDSSETYGHMPGEEGERSREFAEYGYEVLFIRGWEIDLNEKNFEKVVRLLNRIKKFTFSEAGIEDPALGL